jgi:glycosyltransferase involved in cell wall biosynthesis
MLSQKINYLIEELGHEVILCTSEHKNNSFVYQLSDKLKHIDLGINYIRSKSYFHPKNLLKSTKHFKALKATIKNEKPDVITSVNYTPEQYFILFIEKQIPKVKEFHSSGISIKRDNGISGKLKHQLFKLFARYNSLIVLNQDEVKYYPFKNVTVIPNFIKLASHNTIFKKENTIVAAGRIAPVKQFDHLIQAWNKIAHQFPDWQVKIYGDGDEQLAQILNHLISELKVPNIRLLGPTTDLKNEMEKGSVYAMTSATECFPMVLLEAQAAQMALISYDCPYGPRNIIKDNVSGLLTPHNSIEDFSELLKDLLLDQEKMKRLGKQAQLAVAAFSEQRIMMEWQKLFKSLK